MNLESLLRRLPTNLSPETSIRGLFALVSLALIAAACFGISRGQQRLANLRAAISDRSLLLSQKDSLLLVSQTVEQQVDQAKSDCELVVARLPNKPAESEFLTLVSDCAKKFDVSLGDYRPGSIQAKPTASQMELRLRASGSYEGLCQWLDELTQLPRIIQIHHLTFVGPASTGGNCMMDCQIMILFGFTQEIH